MSTTGTGPQLTQALALLRASQDRHLEREGIPMFLALQSVEPRPACPGLRHAGAGRRETCLGVEQIFTSL